MIQVKNRMKTYVDQTLHKSETNAYNNAKKGMQKKLESLVILRDRNIFYDTKERKIIKTNI